MDNAPFPNTPPSDIRIEIYFEGSQPIQSKTFIYIMDAIELAIYDSDRRDIEDMTQVMNIPNILKDAALERIRNHRHERFLMTGVRQGSIEIIGVVAAISLFILENTIGEAFKEGFKETKLYEDLKSLFRQQINTKSKVIVGSLQKALNSLDLQTSVSLTLLEDYPLVESYDQSYASIIRIQIYQATKRTRSVGPISEELRRIKY